MLMLPTLFTVLYHSHEKVIVLLNNSDIAISRIVVAMTKFECSLVKFI